MQFVAGQVVVLKSGGPDMTVKNVSDEGVTCDWFDKSKLNHATFLAEMLDRKQDRVAEMIKHIEQEKENNPGKSEIPSSRKP